MKYRTVTMTICFIGIAFLKCLGQDTSFTGYATALIKNDRVIETHYKGFSNKATSLQYNSSTIQPIGSVSKTFIGLSLLIAKDKGLIDLDKNINEYLDFDLVNPHVKKENIITLRHLATHTSGIVDHEKIYENSYSLDLKPKMALGVYLKEYLSKGGLNYSKKNFNNSTAGSKYEYSNIASGLAAYIIEKVTGKPFNIFTKEYIFDPLKMNTTGWFYDEIEKEKHSILYDEQDKALEPYSCVIYPDGSLKTTINDLSIYLIELIKGFNKKSKLLSEDSWEELFKPSFTSAMYIKNINKKEPNTGVFMIHFKSGNIGHTGSDLGVTTIMLFEPKTGTGKIFMANEDLTENNLDRFKFVWNNLK